MTSPVDTTVKHYRSDMPGAPVLNGVAGSKIAQLEACLCTGYGLKVATSLVVVGGVATLNFVGGASAAWSGAVIQVAGASNAALNGEQKVLSANTAAVTFATAQPDGTDAGASITFKIAAAGWEKVYSKTNVAVFRSLHPESTKMFLRVDDTAAQFSRLTGYETMSSVDAGAGAFPTEGQVPGGGYWAKSDTSSATPVAWILASDGRFFLDSTAPGAHRGPEYQNCFLRGFGDFIPKNPAGDGYLCGINYSTTSDVSLMYEGALDANSVRRTAIARGYTGLGASVQAYRAAYSGKEYSGRDQTMGAFPSQIDGSLILSAQYVSEIASPRGDVPGLRYCPQTGVWSTFGLFDKLVHAGRTYITSCTSTESSLPSYGRTSATGASFIDITGPWR
ncbi:MAG: hypothetical protein JSR53_00325 [Proteobacteria bacterium]|nr:hypothetical protein [Pseudomonadota bacterium]